MVTKMLGTFLKLTIGHFPHVRSYQNDYDPGFFPYKIIWKNLIFNFSSRESEKTKSMYCRYFLCTRSSPLRSVKGGLSTP